MICDDYDRHDESRHHLPQSHSSAPTSANTAGRPPPRRLAHAPPATGTRIETAIGSNRTARGIPVDDDDDGIDDDGE